MLHPQTYAMLEKLKKSLESGDMTPIDRVGPGTFVCMTEALPQGVLYHQAEFDSAPPQIAALLKDRAKGEKVGSIKIVAIFEMWPQMESKETPPVQVFDN